MFCVAFFPDLVPSRSAEGRWTKDTQIDHAHEVETAIMTLLRYRKIVERSVETTRGRYMSAVVVGILCFIWSSPRAHCRLCRDTVTPVQLSPGIQNGVRCRHREMAMYRVLWQVPFCELLSCGLLTTRTVGSASTRLMFVLRPMSGRLIPRIKAGLACTRCLSGHIR